MTLRPASATWSSARDAGRLADDEPARASASASGLAGIAASGRSSRASADARGSMTPAGFDLARAAPASTVAALAVDRGERRLELAVRRPAQPGLGVERVGERPQRVSSPFEELGLELDERSTTRPRLTTSTSSRLSSTARRSDA